MTRWTYRWLNLIPGLIIFRKVYQVWRLVRHDGEPGLLGRLDYHRLHRHSLLLPRTLDTVRGDPLNVTPRNPNTSFRYGINSQLIRGKLFVRTKGKVLDPQSTNWYDILIRRVRSKKWQCTRTSVSHNRLGPPLRVRQSRSGRRSGRGN